MAVVEEILHHIVSWSILLFEFIGVAIIIWTGLKGFRCYLKGNPDTKLVLAKGMATGLEFKLGSEVLRTVVVREWFEVGFVAGIIAIRAFLTFLIHWEIMQAEKGQEKMAGTEKK